MQTTPIKCVSAGKVGVSFRVLCVEALLIPLFALPLIAQTGPLVIQSPANKFPDMMEGRVKSVELKASYPVTSPPYGWSSKAWTIIGLPSCDQVVVTDSVVKKKINFTPDVGTGGQTYTVTLAVSGVRIQPVGTIGNPIIDTDEVQLPLTVHKPVEFNGARDLGRCTDGEVFSHIISTQNGYGSIAFSSPDLPSWLSLDPVTGEIYGTPSLTDIGVNTFTVRAVDSWTGDFWTPSPPTEDEATFTIDVYDVALFTDALPNARVGEDYRFALQGDGAGDLIWTVSNLPEGLSVDADGVISGVPAAGTEGVHAVTVELTDVAPLGESVPVTTRLALVVNGEFSGALTVTTAILPTLSAGEAMPPIRLAALGGTGSYTWIIQGLPAGLRLVDGEIVGAPEQGVEGAYPLKLIVNDGVSSTSAIVTLQVSSSTDSPEQDNGKSLSPAPNAMPNLAGAAAGCTLAPSATSSAIKGQIVVSLLLFALSMAALRRRFSDLRA